MWAADGYSYSDHLRGASPLKRRRGGLHRPRGAVHFGRAGLRGGDREAERVPPTFDEGSVAPPSPTTSRPATLHIKGSKRVSKWRFRLALQTLISCGASSQPFMLVSGGAGLWLWCHE